ncbi:TPA: NAD(P)H-binding protein [Escherichia coli]|nr:NAD(P)H-binding protein [Escherichia coli]
MIAITGATGQLGHYVIESLMKTVPASQIVAIVRNPAKAQALTAQGITVRQADYGDEAALTSALQGVEKLLLISSSEVGQRAPQHRNVINAAKAAGVKFIAYTSLLHADTSPLGLADEHIETEKMLADSDVGASKGGLFDNSKTLSKLIGRPTTTLAESVSHLFNVNN